jgi:nitrogen PTS system EIIA component
VVALLLLREALPLTEPLPDGLPVTRLFFFIPPSPRAHLDTLARLSRVVAKRRLVELVARGASDEELLQALATAEAPGGGSPKGEGPA